MISENSKWERPRFFPASRERRFDHRDFERWCFRMKKAADTISSEMDNDRDEQDEIFLVNCEENGSNLHEIDSKNAIDALQ